jgi:23S rRNA (guanosine2251-2'-O)-methyltransferase
MQRRIAGRRAVTEALRSRRTRLSVVYISSGRASRKPLGEISRLAKSAGVPCEERTRRDLDSLSAGVTHQGVVALAGEFNYADFDSLLSDEEDYPLLLALDGITDPHNLGAIIRSAVAVGVNGVIIPRDRASPVTPAVVRASAGATEHAAVARVTNLSRALTQLGKREMQVVGLDASASEELAAIPYPRRGRVLVVGSEGRGLRRLTLEKCNELARLAVAGPVSSFNASVAAGIALYESARRRPSC